MDKNKIKTIILILLIIIITLINVKLGLNIYKNNIRLKEKKLSMETNEKTQISYYKDMAFYEIQSDSTYYKIKNCVSTYYSAINGLLSEDEYSTDFKGNTVVNSEDKEYQTELSNIEDGLKEYNKQFVSDFEYWVHVARGLGKIVPLIYMIAFNLQEEVNYQQEIIKIIVIFVNN